MGPSAPQGRCLQEQGNRGTQSDVSDACVLLGLWDTQSHVSGTHVVFGMSGTQSDVSDTRVVFGIVTV